jgi:monoamine oxidase
MKRRKFLRQIGYSLPIALSLPNLMASCGGEEDDGIPNVDRFKKYQVIIIGAGASGLYAGWYLQSRGFKVTVLEASGQIGGRIRSLNDFADFKIELGAEEIHGDLTEWYKIVQQAGASLLNQSTTDYFAFKQDLSNPAEALLKTEVQANQYNDFINSIAFVENASSYSGPDISVEQHFNSTGISWNLKGVVNGMLGNEYGTSDAYLSIKGLAEEDALWSAGDENYTLKDKSFSEILETKFGPVLDNVVKNTQVKTVNHQGEKIILTDQTGKTWEADRVIVTVPLTVLKSGDISFTPSLPSAKQDAIDSIGMGAGMKVIFKFSQPFWEDLLTEDLGAIIGYNQVPQLWATSAGRGNIPVLTALIMGDRAEQYSSMGNDAKNSLLFELDNIFGGTFASNAILNDGVFIQDWKKEPFIKGAYSFPKVGGGLAFRQVLASPIDDRLFFAGEATHYEGHSATVHGAIETAIRAIEELEDSIPL